VPEIPAIFDGLSFDEIVSPVVQAQENGIASVVVQDDANKIIKFEKIAGDNGLYSHLTLATGETNDLATVDPIVFEEGNAKLGMWVHTAQAGTKVRLQIGDSAAGGYPNDTHWVEVEASTTKAGWEYLTFDFENPASRFVADGDANTRGYDAIVELKPGVTYDMLAVFFDLGVKKIATETYYLDELTPLSLKSDTPPADIDYAEISPIPDGYKLVAYDNFDSDSTQIAPDSSVWRMETGAGGWGNEESQTYENGLDDAYLQDGHLHIIAKSTGGTITSARLKSDLGDTLDPYGYVEVRAKLPAETGAWPAIWLLGQGEWPKTGEIDIVEWSAKYFKDADGNFLDKRVEAALHFYGDGNVSAKKTYGDTGYKEGTTLADSVENFHTYQLWWTPEYIRIGVDGNINTAYLEYTKPANATPDNWPFTNPMDIILNLAIGGTLGGDLPEGDFQYEMVVDYVRVYQSGEPSGGNFTTLDFSDNGYQFNAFEGTTASVITDPSAQGSTNKVLAYVESATAKNYAGVSMGLDSAFSVDPIAFDVAAGETAISARVWVDSNYGIGQVVRMQVADTSGSDDSHYVEAQATVTQSGWNTLVFDFSQPVSRYVGAWGTSASVALATDVVYDKITMFVDWNNGYAWDGSAVGTPPSADRTYYIDDVTFVANTQFIV
jgi:beta-glucanase (GH16 family)